MNNVSRLEKYKRECTFELGPIFIQQDKYVAQKAVIDLIIQVETWRWLNSMN